MTALVLAAAVSQSVPADPAPTPAPTYTIADVIGRNPDDVCALAFHSGHWSDWLKATPMSTTPTGASLRPCCIIATGSFTEWPTKGNSLSAFLIPCPF
jgi:hypothetical protein